MAHSFEHGRPPARSKYWTALLFGLTTIAAAAGLFLAVYYAL
jgi:hypothetical protein